MRCVIQFVATMSLLTVPMTVTIDGAAAQGRHDAVVIVISKPADVCHYQVQDVEGVAIEGQQDTFLIRAGGFLHVVADDTNARVEIKDDPEKNVRGFERKGTLKLNSGDDGFLQARKRLPQNKGSNHKVVIDCCESFDVDGVCLGLTASQPITYLDGAWDRGGNLTENPLRGVPELRFMSSDGSVEDPPVGPGGPGMNVDP